MKDATDSRKRTILNRYFITRFEIVFIFEFDETIVANARSDFFDNVVVNYSRLVRITNYAVDPSGVIDLLEQYISVKFSKDITREKRLDTVSDLVGVTTTAPLF
jgi:hypothetical protein